MASVRRWLAEHPRRVDRTAVGRCMPPRRFHARVTILAVGAALALAVTAPLALAQGPADRMAALPTTTAVQTALTTVARANAGSNASSVTPGDIKELQQRVADDRL